MAKSKDIRTADAEGDKKCSLPESIVKVTGLCIEALKNPILQAIIIAEVIVLAGLIVAGVAVWESYASGANTPQNQPGSAEIASAPIIIPVVATPTDLPTATLLPTITPKPTITTTPVPPSPTNTIRPPTRTQTPVPPTKPPTVEPSKSTDPKFDGRSIFTPFELAPSHILPIPAGASIYVDISKAGMKVKSDLTVISGDASRIYTQIYGDAKVAELRKGAQIKNGDGAYNRSGKDANLFTYDGGYGKSTGPWVAVIRNEGGAPIVVKITSESKYGPCAGGTIHWHIDGHGGDPFLQFRCDDLGVDIGKETPPPGWGW